MSSNSASAPFPLYKNAIQAMLQFLTLPQLHIAMQVNKLFLSAVSTMKSVAPILTLQNVPGDYYQKSALAKRVNTIGLETITSTIEHRDTDRTKADELQELFNAFPCLTETYQFHMDRVTQAEMQKFTFPVTLKIIDMSCASNVLNVLFDGLHPRRVPLLHTLKLKVVTREHSSDVKGFRELVGLTELHLLVSDAYGYGSRSHTDDKMEMLRASLVSEARRLPNLSIFNLTQGAPEIHMLEIFAGKPPSAKPQDGTALSFPVPEDDGEVVRLSKLERIDCYGVTLSAEYLNALSWFGSTLTDINYAMTGFSCTDLFTPLSRMSALKRLHLKFDFNNSNIRTPSRENYTNAVCSVSKTLTSLQVQHPELSDDDLQRILYACKSLQELIVQDCPALLQLAYFSPTEMGESDSSKQDRTDQSCTATLRSLSLYRCSNLPASEAHHLRGLISLRKLDIRDSFAEVLGDEEKNYFDPNNTKCHLPKLEQFFYQFRGPLRRIERTGKTAESI